MELNFGGEGKGMFSSVNFINGYFVDGFGDKSLDGFGNLLNMDCESDNPQDRRMGKSEKEGSCEAVSDDIVDRLPADPFNMDIRTTFTAFKGWVGDFEKDSIGFGVGEMEAMEAEGEDRGLYANLNLVWSGAMRFQPEFSNAEKSVPCNEFDGLLMDKDLCDGGFSEFLSFSRHGNRINGNQEKEFQACTKVHPDDETGEPHDALFFSLAYLGVQDLLVVERVCRSLCNVVRSDPLLWRNICIDQPLSDKITDDALLQLTGRAQGSLQGLSLVQCPRITDSGLKRVLENNPRLTELCVPGCVRLSVDCILLNLKAFKSAGTLGIKHLRISGLNGVTDQHFEELKLLLGVDNHKQLRTHKPRFYHGEQLYLSCDDDRAIDIEVCPRCQKVRLVYDCPSESCQGKHQSAQLCRACTLCIARCFHCGRCINDCDYEETFCLDLLCLDCFKQLLNCQERQEEMGAPSSKHTIFHQETRYRFCLYG